MADVVAKVQDILEKYGAHEMAKAKGYAYKSIGMTQPQAKDAIMALFPADTQPPKEAP